MSVFASFEKGTCVTISRALGLTGQSPHVNKILKYNLYEMPLLRVVDA